MDVSERGEKNEMFRLLKRRRWETLMADCLFLTLNHWQRLVYFLNHKTTTPVCHSANHLSALPASLGPWSGTQLEGRHYHQHGHLIPLCPLQYVYVLGLLFQTHHRLPDSFVAMVTDHQFRNNRWKVVGMHTQRWSSCMDQLLQSTELFYSSTQFCCSWSWIKMLYSLWN